jgi:AcrR family transcriptional regulator
MADGGGTDTLEVAAGDGAVPAARRQRSDAVQNRRRILEAAEAVFSEHGVSAPIDQVAERAGVGVGTLYRHFSTKEALFEAIVLTRLEGLVEHLADQSDDGDPGTRFFAFLDELATSMANKHDLVDALSDAGIDIKSTCGSTMVDLQQAVERLLDRARAAGAVRAGVTAPEVFGLVVGVCHATERTGLDAASRRRMLDVVEAGLRPPAGA